MTKTIMDWARVTDRDIANADPGLVERLHIWVDMNMRLGRVILLRRDELRCVTVYEACALGDEESS